MTSGIYNIFRQKLHSKNVDVVNDTINCVLIENGYIPNYSNDLNISYIPEDSILSEKLLTGKFLDENYFKADNIVFDVITLDTAITGLLLYKDDYYIEDNFLVCFFELSLVGDGTAITILWSSQGIFSI